MLPRSGAQRVLPLSHLSIELSACKRKHFFHNFESILQVDLPFKYRRNKKDPVELPFEQ